MEPLHGITVLDVSSVILGPMAGQYLGDMGADVIKIEAPEGNITRSIGPRRSEGMGALFLANNRNKRSVVLDLKTADGQAALHRLAARSNVLLHSIRSSAAARIGLAAKALGRATVARIKQIPIEDDVLNNASIRADGRMVSDVYLFEVKQPSESKSEFDLYNLRAMIGPDDAWRPMSEGGCPLVAL